MHSIASPSCPMTRRPASVLLAAPADDTGAGHPGPRPGHRRIRLGLVACGVLVFVLGSSLARAQQLPNPMYLDDYPSKLPPATRVYPEYAPPTRGQLSSYLDVFWQSTKAQESAAGQWWPKHGRIPLPGQADHLVPGDKNTPRVVISMGMSQIVWKNIKSGANLDQYLYDPVYNEQLGHNMFNDRMRARANNPCSAWADYNWGPGNTNLWVSGSFSKTHTPYDYSIDKPNSHGVYFRAVRLSYIDHNLRHSMDLAARFGFSAEVEKALRTSPGCRNPQSNVKPEILSPIPASAAVHPGSTTPPPPPPPGGPSGGSVDNTPQIPVEGYCDLTALKTVTDLYKARQADRDATYEPLYRQIKTVPEEEQQMASLSSCVDLSWPTISLTWPSMDLVIRGVAKDLVRKACSAARDAISKETSKLNGAFYFNPRIPGVPPAGLSIYTPPPGR